MILGDGVVVVMDMALRAVWVIVGAFWAMDMWFLVSIAKRGVELILRKEKVEGADRREGYIAFGSSHERKTENVLGVWRLSGIS